MGHNESNLQPSVTERAVRSLHHQPTMKRLLASVLHLNPVNVLEVKQQRSEGGAAFWRIWFADGRETVNWGKEGFIVTPLTSFMIYLLCFLQKTLRQNSDGDLQTAKKHLVDTKQCKKCKNWWDRYITWIIKSMYRLEAATINQICIHEVNLKFGY